MEDEFDKLIGRLTGLPDVVRTKETVVRAVPLLGVGGTETYIIQTFRQEGGDVIFLEHVSKDGTTRIAIPPEVTRVIARHRDQLTDKNRSRAAKQRAEDDKAAGKLPGFMRVQK